jgi:hypothetical protein
MVVFAMSVGCNVAPLCAMHTYIICNGN